MADEKDQESKTEEPTEKRIADAIEKGNVPIARDVTLFGSIIGLLGTLLLLASWSAAQLMSSLKTALGAAGTMRIDDREAAASFLTTLLAEVSIPLLPVLALLAAGSLIASMVQHSPSMAGDRIEPKLSRISLFSGWTRLFGKAGLVEFAKSTIKILGVTAILWFLFKRDLPAFVAALAAEPGALPQRLLEMASSVTMPLLGFALLLALIDLVWSRFRWRRDLRMTHQELKEEMKEAEGDPHIKAKIRSIGRQRASRRMLEKLPTASMVITNPTHYAVALRYARDDGGAPVVVAKGADHLAMKIREIATQHEIPLVENKPLARGLYDQVEVDAQIPPEFYRAVAEIIHYLNKTGRLPEHARLN